MSNEFLGEMNEFFDGAQQGTTPTSIIRQTTTNQNQVLEMFYNKLAEMGMNLDELRPILECEDNLLILSGAGAGKTTTLILKIIRDLLSGTMMTVNTVNTIHGVSHVHVPAKILVSTFLRTGAQELQASLREWCEKLGVTGVDYSSIQFKTIHSEVKDAITHMGAPVRILENTNDLIKSVALKYGIRSVSATTRSISVDEINELATIMAYARNRLDMKRYDHPLASDYGLNTLLMDAFLADFKMFRQATGQMDFEDMQELLLDALRTNPNVENFILARYDYVFVDEFQDTSQLQYELLKFYFKGAKRVIAVGDDDQCLVENTQIRTLSGIKPIKDITPRTNHVLTLSSRTIKSHTQVDHAETKPDHEGHFTKITTESGKQLLGTSNHITFATLPTTLLKSHTLLLKEYNPSKDPNAKPKFKLGVADKRQSKTLSLKDFVNLQNGERGWVIFEEDNSDKFSDRILQIFNHLSLSKMLLPSLLLHDLELETQHVDALFNLLSYDKRYPHIQGSITAQNRNFIEFKLNDDKKTNKTSMRVATYNKDFANIVNHYLGVKTERKQNSTTLHRANSTSVKHDVQFNRLKDILHTGKDQDIHITPQYKYGFSHALSLDFMPLSQLKPDMLVLVHDGEEYSEPTLERIQTVETFVDTNTVVDLSTPDTRTFFANDILVHNCIYSWRGSDNTIIIEKFEQDVNPTILKLTTNYRCRANILNAVIPSIESNPNRHQKELRAAKEGGEVSIVYDADVNHMVTSMKSDLMRRYSVGVLARTNADLLIPALILELDGNINFSLSKSVNLNGRMPRQIIGMLDLVTKRLTNDFESLFKTFLRKYDWHEAEKLYNVLVANRSLSIYSIEEKDLEYSVPTLYHGFLKGLRQAYKKDQVTAYLYILELLEQKVYTGSSTYVQKARDLTYFIKKLIMEHDTLKDLSLSQIDVLFRSTLPERLATRTKYNTNASVKLTTVHEAKGKEWDSVYIWNNTEGAFPNQVGNRDLTEDEFQEERRVHYIAWTRAKDKLTVYTSKLKPGTFLKECNSSYYNQTNPEPESETKHLFKRDTGTPTLDTMEKARTLTQGYISHLRQTGGITDDNVANMEIVVSNYEEKELVGIMHDEYGIGATKETEYELRELFANIFSALADRIIMGGNYHV